MQDFKLVLKYEQIASLNAVTILSNTTPLCSKTTSFAVFFIFTNHLAFKQNLKPFDILLVITVTN